MAIVALTTLSLITRFPRDSRRRYSNEFRNIVLRTFYARLTGSLREVANVRFSLIARYFGVNYWNSIIFLETRAWERKKRRISKEYRWNDTIELIR